MRDYVISRFTENNTSHPRTCSHALKAVSKLRQIPRSRSCVRKLTNLWHICFTVRSAAQPAAPPAPTAAFSTRRHDFGAMSRGGLSDNVRPLSVTSHGASQNAAREPTTQIAKPRDKWSWSDTMAGGGGPRRRQRRFTARSGRWVITAGRRRAAAAVGGGGQYTDGHSSSVLAGTPVNAAGQWRSVAD